MIAKRVLSPEEQAVERGLRVGACLLIAIFWAVHFAMLSFRASVKPLGDPFVIGLRRAALTAFGALLCYGIYFILKRCGAGASRIR